MSEALIRSWYDAFNRHDPEAMLALLTEDAVHDVNQGGREVGRPAFRAFLERMDRCYREQVADLVVFADPSGARGAAEFTVIGTYLATDPAPGMPEAAGQTYRLPAGAFFGLRDGRVARLTMYYNLEDWLAQVGAARG